MINGSSNTHAQAYSKSLTNIFITWKTFESSDDALVVKSSYCLMNQYLDLRLLHVEHL
jgi:hypothetical protein